MSLTQNELGGAAEPADYRGARLAHPGYAAALTRGLADSATLVAAALEYVARGWAVVALHDVVSGGCSCGRPEASHERGQWGKHPRAAGWREVPIRDRAGVEAAWSTWPSANVGVVTGRASGVWVLDVDPDHGGDERLAELLAEHREWPAAGRLTLTGSSGHHWWFALPSGGQLITNSRGRLPLGLDVRGEGGQVVAPPSISAKGPYEVITDVAMPPPAPTWLLDLVLRPAAPEWLAGDSTGQLRLSPSAAGRGPAYAAAAIEAVCEELAGAAEGERNERAFRVACRLIEVAHAPWAGVTLSRARALYDRACEIASASGSRPFPPSEADRVWRNALDDVGHGVARLPPTALGGESVPFGMPPAIGGSLATPGPGEAEATPNPFEVAVAAEVWRLAVRAEAQRRLVGASAPTVASLRAKMLGPADLRSIRSLEPLVDGLLYRDTLARVVGPSGAGKSWVALDLAGAVGSGLPWAGREVAQGRVVYIVAEGAGSLRRRVEAWQLARQLPMAGVQFFPEPIQLVDASAWGAMTELLIEIGPALVILDTQARLTVGVEESDAPQMGMVVAALDVMRVATGACVLLVHHTGHQGTHGRGSTAVLAALQTELSVRAAKPGRLVELGVIKGRDDAPIDPMIFEMTPIALPPEILGRSATSIALTYRPDDAGQAEADALSGAVADLAALMAEVFALGNGGTKAEAKGLFLTRRLGAPASFYRAWNQLLALRVIGRVRGLASWRYIEPADRGRVTSACDADSANPGAFFAP